MGGLLVSKKVRKTTGKTTNWHSGYSADRRLPRPGWLDRYGRGCAGKGALRLRPAGIGESKGLSRIRQCGDKHAPDGVERLALPVSEMSGRRDIAGGRLVVGRSAHWLLTISHRGCAITRPNVVPPCWVLGRRGEAAWSRSGV